MTEKKLRNSYKKFLKFNKFYFFLDAKKYSTSLQNLKVSDKLLNQFYQNYQILSFFSFLKKIKDIIYSKNVFDFILKNSTEDWKLWSYLKFLEKEKIIKVKKRGEVSILKKGILDLIPKPLTKEEIKERIEKKLRLKIEEKKPVTFLFKNFKEFEIKGKWDQMPISQGSALFLTKKLLEYLPLNKRFLFVGDDDFISVILGLVNPKIESLVVDADEQLLDCLNSLAKKFNLKIKTKKVDVRERKILARNFIGFLTNPIYTEEGIKKFLKYGISQLGKDGGFIFLEIGDEAIGNRYLFLEDFFVKNNLILRELILGQIFYPYIELYKEDKEILRRLKEMISERIIKKSPKLAASLYIFEYLPQKPKKIKFKKPIYAYL